MNKIGRYMQKSLYLDSILSVFLILAGLTFTFDSAFAQSGIGSIEGTVTDPTGAVVPGAAVHVVNNETHIAADAKSNDAGFFQVPGLFTATYTVTVSAPGMKTYTTSIELLVAQTAVINPKLAVGAETQQVIVNANSVQLTTNDSGSISSTLEYQRINQLPENGREITTLLQETTPGIENVSQNTGGNINGLNPEALSFIVDGANLTSNEFGGLQFGLTQLIDPDAIQEAHVEISNGGAQYASPGTVVMSTRSGTNHIHGTMFETARNNAFGEARPFDTLNYVFPELIRNEFGASAGGPVVLPHLYHGRDKTFWFFAYERYSQAQQTVGLAAVPTYGTPGLTGPGAGMNNGDFSSLVTAAGKLDTLYDPSTTYNSGTAKCAANGAANAYCRTPFANNQIPVSEESPFAQVYYAIVPKPDIANVTDPLVQDNLSYTSPAYEVVDQQTGRLDHEFNENNRAFVRFTRIGNPVNISSGSVPRSLAADGIPNGAAMGYANNTTKNYTAATDYTHVFSPSFFSETVYSMQWFTSHHTSGNAPTTDYESMLNLPNNFGEAGFPAIGAKELITPLTSSQTGNLANLQIDLLLSENLTKTIGRHQIYFGGRFNHNRNAEKPNGLADSATFSGDATGVYQPTSGAKYTAVTNTGYYDADMFLGSASDYHVTLEPPFVHSHLNEFDAYVQDNFHVSEKLTVNFGLRYEAHPALWTKGGVANSFDLKNDAMVLASTTAQLIAKGYTTQAIITNDQNLGVKFETPQEAGFPASLMYNYDFNFLPRLGFAWIPFHTGIIFRGGFGQYEYATPLSDYSLPSQSNNPFTASYDMSYLTAAQATDDAPDEQLRYNDPVKFPVMGTSASATAVNTGATNSILPGISLSSASPNWKPVEITQANATIEQPLRGNSALRVTWLFDHAANLDLEDSYNNHPSEYQYESAYGTVFPTGTVIDTPTYSTTAPGPYDQTTWASGSTLATKNGWSNYNALQINYQRLYHHGVAYQISYVYGKSMRAGGDIANAKSILSTKAPVDTSSIVDVDPDANYPGVLGNVSQMSVLAGGSTPYAGFAPPPRPAGLPVWADYKEMDRYQLYQLDNNIPKVDIKFNGILDLPIGRGKWLLHNSPRWLNEIVGGFQIAGDGDVVSQVFIPDSSMWGPTSQIHVYKHKIPITDCRSGACNKGYLWFNGYLSPLVIGANCPNAPACVTGVPSNYTPYQTPINNNPTSAYFGTDGEDVQLTLPGTSPVTSTGAPTNTIAYDAGPVASNYTSKTYLNGPITWNADLSLFKVFPIKGNMNLRLNFDAFNAFNHPGDVNPNPTDGTETFLTAMNTQRELQITARFTF